MQIPFWCIGLGRLILDTLLVLGWVGWNIVLAPLAWTFYALAVYGGDEERKVRLDRDLPPLGVWWIMSFPMWAMGVVAVLQAVGL